MAYEDDMAFDAMNKSTKSKADNIINPREIRRGPPTRESFSIFGKEDLDFMTREFGKEEFGELTVGPEGRVTDWGGKGEGKNRLRSWEEEYIARGDKDIMDTGTGREIDNILRKAQKRGGYNFDQINKEGGFGTLGNPVAFNERYMDEQFKKSQSPSPYLESVGKITE